MDVASIVAALITGTVTVFGVILSNSKTQAVIEQRIDVLERSYNELKEQVKEDHELKERIAVVEQSLKAIWRRIDEHAGDIEELKKGA